MTKSILVSSDVQRLHLFGGLRGCRGAYHYVQGRSFLAVTTTSLKLLLTSTHLPFPKPFILPASPLDSNSTPERMI